MELFFHTENKLEKIECDFIGRTNFVALINQFDAKLASLSEAIKNMTIAIHAILHSAYLFLVLSCSS